MRMSAAILGIGMLLGSIAPASAQYGDISDVKLLKPEDKQDVKSSAAPEGAIVLFDGKSLDGWVKRSNPKEKAAWKLLDGGIAQVEGGDIITEKTSAATSSCTSSSALPTCRKQPDKDGAIAGSISRAVTKSRYSTAMASTAKTTIVGGSTAWPNRS